MQARILELRSALRKGLGRAALLLRENPDSAEMQAELLHACTTNLVFDKQSDEGRAPYLHHLIGIVGQADRFRRLLWDRLRTAPPDADASDLVQVFELLCLIEKGSEAGQAALRAFVLTTPDRPLGEACLHGLIGQQGLDALLAGVRRFAPEIEAYPWSLRSLQYTLADRDGEDAARAAMDGARRSWPELDRLAELADAEADRIEEEGKTALRSYADTKAEIGRVRRLAPWVRALSQTELEQAAEDLLVETDETRLAGYLRAFRWRDFPNDPTSLFPFVRSGNRAVRYAALGALGRLAHPAVRRFALDMLDGAQPDLGARLLRGSAEPDDLERLGPLLERLAGNERAYHDVSLSTLDILGRVGGPGEQARAILLHLYENSDCSFCRGTAVDKLAAMDAVPAWMAEEGAFDAVASVAERFDVAATA